jgi:hypothetical protein
MKMIGMSLPRCNTAEDSMATGALLKRRNGYAVPVLSGLAWGAIASGILASRGEAQSMPQSLAEFLQQTIAMTQQEMSAVAKGSPFVKVLDSPNREVAVFGIVGIGVPRKFYVGQIADSPSWVPDHSPSRFGRFSDPATASDVRGVSLSHDDLEDLKNCRPGSCVMKLSDSGIAYIRAIIDSGSLKADSVVNAYFRRRMVEYVTAYRARGNAALLVYADRKSASAAAQVFSGIVSRSPYMYRYAPSLQKYLENYPNNRPAGTREALFWSDYDLSGSRPTLTITHQVVYTPPELPRSTLIVSKQLYANHYLDGGLELADVVDAADASAAAPAIYVVVLSRLHFDNLPSGGLINIRHKVTDKLKERTGTLLRVAKASSEQAYARAGGS